MTSRILVSSDLSFRILEIERILEQFKFSKNSPDLFYLDSEEKLGVENTKNIREFLSIKPYSADFRIVAIESADKLTLDAQNSLLKTLEETPGDSFLILGVNREGELLPTILSRCTIVTLTEAPNNSESGSLIKSGMTEDVEKVLQMSLEDRFEYVEKLEDKEKLLDSLADYFREKLPENPKYAEILKEILNAYKYKEEKGNIRVILEYIMLSLP